MGNRCPDCQKFVGLEQADPEVDSVEITSAGEINPETGEQAIEVGGDVRLVLNCAECSSEMKEANLTLEGEVTFTHSKVDKRPEGASMSEPPEDTESVMCDATEEDFEVEVDSSEPTDAYRPEGRPARYQTHYYGVEVTVRVKCNKCAAEDTFDIDVEESAGSFEEMF